MIRFRSQAATINLDFHHMMISKLVIFLGVKKLRAVISNNYKGYRQ